MSHVELSPGWPDEVVSYGVESAAGFERDKASIADSYAGGFDGRLRAYAGRRQTAKEGKRGDEERKQPGHGVSLG